MHEKPCLIPILSYHFAGTERSVYGCHFSHTVGQELIILLMLYRSLYKIGSVHFLGVALLSDILYDCLMPHMHFVFVLSVKHCSIDSWCICLVFYPLVDVSFDGLFVFVFEWTFCFLANAFGVYVHTRAYQADILIPHTVVYMNRNMMSWYLYTRHCSDRGWTNKLKKDNICKPVYQQNRRHVASSMQILSDLQ